MDEPPHAEIGRRIRMARIYRKHNQDWLAEVLEVSKPVVVDIEAGRRHVTRGERLAIAEATELPVEFFTADWGRLAQPLAGEVAAVPPQHTTGKVDTPRTARDEARPPDQSDEQQPSKTKRGQG